MAARLGCVVLGWLCISACSTQVPAVKNGSQAPATPAQWTLVWEDGFDGETLDRTKWTPEISCWGGGNEERQCYVDSPDNIEISAGALHLKAFKGAHTGPKYPQGHPGASSAVETRPYTSGKIRTKDLAAWTYGRFEARMKLPQGQGTWPAFWMLSNDDDYGTWPHSGEIDILEAVNLGATCEVCTGDEGENRTIAALHFGDKWPDNTFLSTKFELPGSPGVTQDYHTFSAQWGEGRIDWFVDGVKYYSLSQDDWFTGGMKKSKNPIAPFDKPFYIMFNLAVGGGLSERNNDKGFNPDSFPAELLVDWVRVYQCAGDAATGLACMGPE